MPAAIETAGLTRRFGPRTALDEMTTTVHRGELCALVGHNGSGKSTALRLAAGLLTPSSGTITVSGARPGSRPAREVVSYVGDTPVLYDDLSILEHLELIAGLCRLRPWRPRAHELAAALAIDDHLDQLPAALSRGLRQRAALALGLLRPHDVLLIDEPLAGLDVDGQAVITHYLQTAAADGVAVFVATHHEAVTNISDRVIALDDGHVVFDGPAATWSHDT